MINRHSKKSSDNILTAHEHVNNLFKQADDAFNEDSSLSDRYVSMARSIAMKFKLKLKSEYKRKICKHCYKYLRPGVNCRVRNQTGKIVYSCFSCKKFTRFPIK